MNSNLARTGEKNGMFGIRRFGESNPFYGKKHSEETKEKLRKSAKGRKMSDETKRKISEKMKGRSNYWLKGKKMTPEQRKNLSDIRKGKKKTIEHRKKLSDAQKGELSHFWRGGITNRNTIIRQSITYRLWREAVYKRDNYTCIICGIVGGKLNAHHIKPFSSFPELRFCIDNGITLCYTCHKMIHKKENTLKINKYLIIN
jgi:predicted restriction endonuclease